MGRCRLMWPPSAWPTANSSPQIGHSCILSLLDPSSPGSCGFLWLARCPPSAWKEGNCFLHVLHSNTLPGGDWLASSLVGETKTHILAWSSLLGLYKYVWSKYLSISRYVWNRRREWMFCGSIRCKRNVNEVLRWGWMRQGAGNRDCCIYSRIYAGKHWSMSSSFWHFSFFIFPFFRVLFETSQDEKKQRMLTEATSAWIQRWDPCAFGRSTLLCNICQRCIYG